MIFLFIFWYLVSKQNILSQKHLYVIKENSIWSGVAGDGDVGDGEETWMPFMKFVFPISIREVIFLIFISMFSRENIFQNI